MKSEYLSLRIFRILCGFGVATLLVLAGCAEDPEAQKPSSDNSVAKESQGGGKKSGAPLSETEFDLLRKIPEGESKLGELPSPVQDEYRKNQMTQKKILKDLAAVEIEISRAAASVWAERASDVTQCRAFEAELQRVVVSAGEFAGCHFDPVVKFRCEEGIKVQTTLWQPRGSACPVAAPMEEGKTTVGECLGLPGRPCEAVPLPETTPTSGSSAGAPVFKSEIRGGVSENHFHFSLAGFSMNVFTRSQALTNDGNEFYVFAEGQAPGLGKIKGEVRLQQFPVAKSPRESWEVQEVHIEGSLSYYVGASVAGINLSGGDIEIGPIKFANVFTVDLCQGIVGDILSFIDGFKEAANSAAELAGQASDQYVDSIFGADSDWDSEEWRDLKSSAKRMARSRIAQAVKDLQSIPGGSAGEMCSATE